MYQLTAVIHYPLDLAGIFAFALCGALLAVRKDFGLFGTVVLAEVTGVGGGLFRDIVLGVTPIAFTDLGYALAPVAAAGIVFFSLTTQRHPMVCQVLDAAALGLFSVTGTIKGLAHGFGPLPSVALGIATAVGGGTFNSVLAREIPPVLRWDQDLYALPAVTGAGGVGALHGMRMLTIPTAMWVAIAAFVIRLLALHFHWRAPRSLVWRSRQSAGPPPLTAVVPTLHTTLPPRQNLEHTLRMRSSDVSPHGQGREHTLQLRLPMVEGSAVRRTPTHRAHTAHHRSPAHGRDDFPI